MAGDLLVEAAVMEGPQRFATLAPVLALCVACGESSKSQARRTPESGGGTHASGSGGTAGAGETGGIAGSAGANAGGGSGTGGNGSNSGSGGQAAGGGVGGEAGASGGGGGKGSLENCYVATSGSREVRLLRDSGGTYELVSSTLTQTLTFDEATQELWIGYRFGTESFSAALAPDRTLADALFWICTIPPTQTACGIPTRLATALVTCDDTPVSVESAAGCYDRDGGGLRIVISGAPGSYGAVVTEGSGMPATWEVREGPSELVVARPADGLTVRLAIGSTGRVRAVAAVAAELSRDGQSTTAHFISCD